MDGPARFQEAIRRIDEANREDPRTDMVAGVALPRELRFAERVYQWVSRLVDDPSEVLLLAARSHTIRRWAVPRGRFPKNTRGYHEWREALAAFHADEAAAIFLDLGYPDETVQAVRSLITREHWPESEDACVLEDADCLAFLELKLERYLDEWDEDKTLRVLRQTHQKMTPNGRAHLSRLDLPPRAREVLRRATS